MSGTRIGRRHAAGEVQGSGGLASAAPAVSPRARRRPAVLAASVLAVCLGALLGWWAYSSASTAQQVIGLRSSVARGAVIGAQDLVSVSVGLDPALHPVPVSELSAVVGRRAAVDLPAGGLLTREAVTAVVVPARGQSVVGVAVAAGMWPSSGLQVGDRVRVVTTSGTETAGDPAAAATAPEVIDAQVVGVGAPGIQDRVVVDVIVPQERAAVLAARAATGKVALVLDSRER